MIRVLFVDDEVELLDGLRNRLWRKRREWEMSFALGGQSALEVLKRQQFDIVVSDLRMPLIDGTMLLERVRRDQPTAIRILLSGETSFGVTRHLDVAQQILGKPCPIELLEDTIERAQRVRTTVSDPEIQRRVGEVAAIPAVPELVLELDNVLSNPNGSLRDAEHVITREPAFATRVLQIANSGFFGARRATTSVEEAVSLLGLESLKAVALTHELSRPYGGTDETTKKALRGLQTHSLAVARAAAQFFDETPLCRSAFAAGLLHELGALLADPAFRVPGSRAGGADRIAPDGSPGLTSGNQGLEVVGAYAVAIWGLPFALVEAVLYHREPWCATQTRFDLPAAIYVANHLVTPRFPSPSPDPRDSVDLDLEFLEKIGVARSLPIWTALVQDLEPGDRKAA
ncbi:MAG: HDOD domain-containing protein [Candidatus Eisenbacteria bacterium]|nr:HDOD domain-containing protein [Candidatus Eisenbacteria bacterium]MCC7143221.1 HDOD domain-containing protein [Candidatus Eisenbacteria bacterium]